MLCTHCGTDNVAHARFCAGCGQPPAAGPDEYYVHHAPSNQVYGPLKEAAVREWVAQRRLAGADNVRAAGSETWVPLARTPFWQAPVVAFAPPPALTPQRSHSPLKDEGSSLIITGIGLVCIGIVFSATGIGACIGVPLKLAGVVVIISGVVKQRRTAAPLPAHAAYAPPLPHAEAARRCAFCGSPTPSGAAFCAACGASQPAA